MKELMIFEGKQVEVFEFNGQVLFNPKHVAECLEMEDSTVRKAISKMTEKQVVKIKNSDVKYIHSRKLNNNGENFLTESGVYKFIFKSNKEKAEEFQDWIADEVLPSIRKTGSYTIPNTEKVEEPKPKAIELERLDTINRSLEFLAPLLSSAGINNNMKLLVAKGFYEKAGINIPVEIKAEEPYYDTKQISKMVGIYSNSGLPAYQAVAQILKKLDIEESEKQAVWEGKGSWQGTVIKYTKSVAEKLIKWLKDNAYPTTINTDSRNYYVSYK